MNESSLSQQHADFHQRALVWDNHAGFEFDLRNDLNNIYRWKEAGVDYLSVNAGYDVKSWQLTISALSGYRAFVESDPQRLMLVNTTADIELARASGKLAIGFDIEGMCALNEDVGMVALYYQLGVRQMLIAYNLNNAAGGGCHDEDVGLTPFGRAVVEEMNRVGMIVDCSHSSYRSSMEAMEVSTAPVMFSHSNSRRLHDHERNIKDDQIKACAATGGIVGITGIGAFLDPAGVSVAALVRHIRYMADLIGPDKVGIGLDYDFSDDFLEQTVATNINFWPKSQYPSGMDIGFLAPESFPEITSTLLDSGFSESETLGILGGNFFRLAENVWR